MSEQRVCITGNWTAVIYHQTFWRLANCWRRNENEKVYIFAFSVNLK